MASTYTSDINIELIGTGEQAGSWGATTNQNWSRIGEAASSYATVTVTSASFDWTLSDSVDAHTVSTASTPGSTGRASFVKFVSEGDGDPASTPTINIRGSSASVYPRRVFFAENGLSNSLDLTLNCGSGDTFTLKNGCVAAVYTAPSGPSGSAGNIFSKLQTGGLVIGSTVVTDGVITDSTGLSLAADVTIAGNFLPSPDDTQDLGSASAAWQDLFLEGDITLTDAGTLQSTAGALTITSAAAATWSTAAGELTLSSAGALNLTPNGGSAIVLDGTTTLDGGVLTFTPSTSDTVVMTAATNGAFSLVTTDDAAAAANIEITADGTVDINSAGVLTLDSGAAINIEPADGSAILLDGTISVDAGVVTGATSITSSTFTSTGAMAVTTASDGDITLTPNGTGAVVVASKFNMNSASTFSESSSGVSAGTNVLIGERAGDALTGSSNGGTVALGEDAATKVTSGDSTIALGWKACGEVTTSDDNIGIGESACGGAAASATTGASNVCVGANSGKVLTSGSYNTSIGTLSGSNLTTAIACTHIGTLLGGSAVDVAREIVIGNLIAGKGADTATLGHSPGAIWADLTASGSWASTSDERIKKDIVNSDTGLAFVNALRPVTYKKKNKDDLDGSEEECIREHIDPTPIEDTEGALLSPETSDYTFTGFIAQEVKAAIDAHGENTKANGWSEDKDGLQAVSMSDFIPPLVKAVQELSAQVAGLEARLAAIE